jgi:phosphomannomutase
MSIIYLFDVDGTLTDSRAPVDPEFGAFFSDFCDKHEVALVTGSDYLKTIEQLGKDIWKNTVAFQSSGNHVFVKGKSVKKARPWWPDKGTLDWLEVAVKDVMGEEYEGFGEHFEGRPGTLNVNMVGHKASKELREQFNKIDFISGYRMDIINNFNRTFTTAEATLGGLVSIDIFPKGRSKAQILENPLFDGKTIVFFGDGTMKGGNDYPLVQMLYKRGNFILNTVSNWKETYHLLEEELNV